MQTKIKTINIALVGNPNVGKSVIFNYLTGVYADVSNYPGTTIEIAESALDTNDEALNDIQVNIIDTPGVYGISSFNDEEKATRDYVLNADLVINIVSSISISRDFFLTKQLCDMGKPMIVLLNQSDEAKLHKVRIDTKLISEEIGIDLIETVATEGIGLDILKSNLIKTLKNEKPELTFKTGKISTEIDKFILPYIEKVLTREEALMIAEGDEFIAAQNDIKLEANYKKTQETIYKIRRQEIEELMIDAVVNEKFSKRALLGRLLLNPIWGSIAAIAVLYLFLYQFLGVFVAGTVVDFLETNLFNNIWEPFISGKVNLVFPVIHDNIENLIFARPLAAIGTFLAGDYGVLTLTITYLYGLLMPLVLGFYFGLAVLEDSGYLPRLAVLTDGILSRLGMNGRAIIPLILGGGCVTMAVVTTRLLKTNKEKIITMALLGLTIPCSAQLGVIQGLLSSIGGVKPWLIWGLTLFIVFGITGLVMNKLIDGECGNFISDIPPMRVPKFSNIIKKTLLRSKVFLDEATSAFFIAAATVGFLQVTGSLENTIKWFEPVMSNVLLLPKEVALSFILGMVRRDFGAFGLMDISMTAAQLVTACVVLTLFVPCIATVAIMIKEKNFQTALAIWLSSWILALGLGAGLARILALTL